MNTTTDIKATLECLKATAASQVKQYPQYANHFAGYRLALMKRDVKTKMGLAFIKGEFVIVAPDGGFTLPGTTKFVTAWSRRNAIDTSVKAADLEFVS
jgi:hypothetical protein